MLIIYHIYSVREKHNVNFFATCVQSAGRPAGLTLIITLTHIFHVSQKVWWYVPSALEFSVRHALARCRRDTND